MKKFLLLFLALISFAVNVNAKRYYINLLIDMNFKQEPSYKAFVDLGLNTKSSFGYLYDNEDNGSFFYSPFSIVNSLSNKGWIFFGLTETNVSSLTASILDPLVGHSTTKEIKWENYILYKDCDSDDDVLKDIQLTDKLINPQKIKKDKEYKKKHDKIKEEGDGVYQ